MSSVGYARVSSAGQDLDIQLAALKAAGCDVIRAEKVSGTSTERRADTILAFLRRGDTLTVTRIERLARIADLSNIVRDLDAKGVALKATEHPIDASTAAGKAFPRHVGSLRRV